MARSSVVDSSRVSNLPIELKSKNYNCELKPDDYTDIIDLENDCFGFSSRIMCDFDNKEPEIKQLKPQLYELAEELYDQYRSMILDKNFFINMTCPYIDNQYFEFELVIPDREFYYKKTGEVAESMPVRFANQYSATKIGNIWDVKLIKDKSFDLENPPVREIVNRPECQFPVQGNFRFQKIVQTDYGCYDFTINPESIDLSSKFQDDYFTYSLYDLEVLSRDYFIRNYKDFKSQKTYIVAKDFKFADENKLEFNLDIADTSLDAFQKTKYQESFTLYKKRNGLWFTQQ